VLLRHRILGVAISVALVSVFGASTQAKVGAKIPVALAQSSSATNRTPSSAGAGIALVQQAGGNVAFGGNAMTGSLAFASNNTAGNFIAVVIRSGLASETFTVSDSSGNAYNLALMENQTTDDDTLAIYYAMNIGTGANTVTVTQTNLTTLRFAILEYSGVATSGSLDVSAAAQGSGAFPNGGSVRTTANGDLLLGAVMTSDPEAFAAGSGYGIEQSVPGEPNTKLVVEDQIQVTAGSSSASASLGAGDFWAAGLAAFKAATSGGGTTTTSGGGGDGSQGSAPANQGQLSASTQTLNFGNVNIGSSSSQTITVSSSGAANVTVSNVSTSGAGIAVSGVYVGLILAPGQNVPLMVTFTPAATGSASGSITITSNAANSSFSIAVSGTGVQPVSHSVDLAWNAATGAAGYNVYRGSASGGPYTVLTASPVTTTSFIDTNAQSGQTYYYVVTSLNSNGGESTDSNQVSATIP
jgi:hypothetical protein